MAVSLLTSLLEVLLWRSSNNFCNYIFVHVRLRPIYPLIPFKQVIKWYVSSRNTDARSVVIATIWFSLQFSTAVPSTWVYAGTIPVLPQTFGIHSSLTFMQTLVNHFITLKISILKISRIPTSRISTACSTWWFQWRFSIAGMIPHPMAAAYLWCWEGETVSLHSPDLALFVCFHMHYSYPSRWVFSFQSGRSFCRNSVSNAKSKKQ